MRLSELQRAFWDAVRTRGAPPRGLGELFTSSARQDATERLAVYHHAYWRRQLLALSSTFPRLRSLLGSQLFERLALRYLERWPCSAPCIELLGARLPAFLSEQAGVSMLACDLARFEWAALEALLAPNQRKLSSVPRELGAGLVHCSLRFDASLKLERVSRQALAAFQADTPTLAAGAQPKPTELVWVALFRPHLAVRHVVLTEDEATALKRARQGDSFSSVCEAFSALPHDDAVARMGAVLANWLSRGWITEFAAERPVHAPA